MKTTIVGRCLDKLSAGMMVISIIMLAAMALLMNVEIVQRAAFKSSTMIADEYSGYFFSWLFLCALTFVQRRNGLLKVDVLASRLHGRMAVVCDVLANLIGAIVTGILTWACAEMVIGNWEFGSTSLSTARTPLFIPQSIMPVGLAIATISFLETAVNRLLGGGRSTTDAPEAVI